MNKKVTRRAAIGLGIGGVTAAPFIIRALTRKYSADISGKGWEEVPLPPDAVVGKNPDYGTIWKRDLRLVNTPTKKIGGPSTFQLNYKPEVGATYRLVFLNAAYSKQGGPSAKFPGAPTYYIFVEGLITPVPPIVDDKPALSITQAKIVARSLMISGAEESGGNCVVVKQDGSFDYYQLEQGSPHKVPRAQVSPACSVLGSQLAFDYPRGKPLSIGAIWPLSTAALETGLEASDKIDLNCRVLGFAEVAGRRTVILQAEEHLTSQAYAAVVAAAGGSGPREEIVRSSVAEGPDQTTAEVERLVRGKGESPYADQVLRQGISKEIHLVNYVDLTTGMLVRRELTQALHNSKYPDRDLTTCTFSQVLDT